MASARREAGVSNLLPPWSRRRASSLVLPPFVPPPHLRSPECRAEGPEAVERMD